MSRATDAATGAAFVAIDDDDGNPTVVFATLAGDDGALAAELRAMCANVVDGRFAFPERRAAARERTTDGATTTTRFTFCLTRADGARTIGAVRRVGARRAAAALTRTARFEYHDDVLRHAMTRAMEALDATARGTTRELARGDALWEYLDRTIGTRAPTAGTTADVGLPWTEFAGVATQSVRLRAPDLRKEFNGGIKFTALLDCGHVEAVLALFAALVTERRVVLTSGRLEAVSAAVHAANAALYPLSWQHIFLPVIPEAFLDYLTAPMPFLVGLHSSLSEDAKRLPCDDVFTLNLDDGSFTYFEEDFEAIPSGPFTLLRVGLLREIERTRGEDSQAVARVFRTFFSSVLGPYKQHIKGVVAHPPPRDAIIADSLWLDQRGLELGNLKHAGILAAMRGTQMYEVFVRQRLRMCAQVARKTGFVPMGDEIVDFDLEEGELTLSDLMMRGQALSEQFASASSHAFSVGSSALRETMRKAKKAYSTSKTIQGMREAFASKRSQLAHSIGKLREKSSEDLQAKWAEWTDEGTAKNLSFAEASTAEAPVPAPPQTQSPVVEREAVEVNEPVAMSEPIVDSLASAPTPAPTLASAPPPRVESVSGAANMMANLMSFDDAGDTLAPVTPSKRTGATMADVDELPNLIDM
jgi:hypothetical protein